VIIDISLSTIRIISALMTVSGISSEIRWMVNTSSKMYSTPSVSHSWPHLPRLPMAVPLLVSSFHAPRRCPLPAQWLREGTGMKIFMSSVDCVLIMVYSSLLGLPYRYSKPTREISYSNFYLFIRPTSSPRSAWEQRTASHVAMTRHRTI